MNVIFGPKKADHWKYYKEYFDFKGNFPFESGNIKGSMKCTCSESDKVKTPSNLQDLQVSVKKDMKRTNHDIGVSDNLRLTQEIKIISCTKRF